MRRLAVSGSFWLHLAAFGGWWQIPAPCLLSVHGVLLMFSASRDTSQALRCGGAAHGLTRRLTMMDRWIVRVHHAGVSWLGPRAFGLEWAIASHCMVSLVDCLSHRCRLLVPPLHPASPRVGCVGRRRVEAGGPDAHARCLTLHETILTQGPPLAQLSLWYGRRVACVVL